MPNETITKLLGYGRSNRTLRAYAYLTASFTARPQYDVIDALDCIVPFVMAGIASQAGDQLDLPKLTTHLQTFGLTIPMYALEQMLPRLQKLGAVEWNEVTRCHVCKAAGDLPEVEEAQAIAVLADAFDAIENRLSAFASGHGLPKPPLAPSWTDALIAFLRSESATDVIRAAVVKEALIGDPEKVEAYVIALFIKDVEKHDDALFKHIVQVFTGILIEDFVGSIQSVGESNKFAGLTLFYDTTVLLRLLGTSGRIFQTATLEMHRALQDLKCTTNFLGQTEVEVFNIIDSLLVSHEAGRELFGETAEAISDGEVTIPQLRDLRDSFTVRLGKQNIFPYNYNYSGRKSEDQYQIDETRFGKSLEDEAIRHDRLYSSHNAANDAKALAIVMRLRKGERSLSVATCRFLFISRNRLLQRVARKFSITQGGYDHSNIAPVMTVGQIATIAWLVSSKTLEPSRVTKELLASCYNAVRPSQGWAEEFAKSLADFRSEDPGFLEARANSVLFLGTMRTLARDESLGQPAVLKKLNFAEIVRRAADASDAVEQARDQQSVALQRDAEAFGRSQGAAETAAEAKRRLSRYARIVAKWIRYLFASITTIAVILIFWADEQGILEGREWIKLLGILVLSIPLILSCLDLCRIRIASNVVHKIEMAIAGWLERTFIRIVLGVRSPPTIEAIPQPTERNLLTRDDNQ